MCDIADDIGSLISKIIDWAPPAFETLLGSVNILMGVAIYYFAYRYRQRVHFTHWWDPSETEPDGPLTWDLVDRLMRIDPSEYIRGRRQCSGRRRMTERAVIFLALVIWICIWSLIFRYGATPHAEQIYNIGLGIGGVGVFLTFAGVLYNGRVTVRSRNRQTWINELREALSDLIHAHPNHKELTAKEEAKEEEGSIEPRKPLSTIRAQVELMLNPAKRDHRALIALVRYFYQITDIEIDKIVLTNLRIKPDIEALSKDEFIELKSRLIRLINAVLKREWERVKHVR